jgi:hypothetical protein
MSERTYDRSFTIAKPQFTTAVQRSGEPLFLVILLLFFLLHRIPRLSLSRGRAFPSAGYAVGRKHRTLENRGLRIAREGKMPDAQVSKVKFDSLLRKMLATPPLPKSELRVGKRKAKAKAKGAV